MTTPDRPALAPATGLAADAVLAGEPPWQRLSTRMLLVHPVQELGRALPALIAVLFAGASSGDGPLWGLVGTGVMVCLGLLRWYTTAYRIGADQVQVRRGLLRRRVVSVPRDRIRTVDVTAHALHRALGLTRVTIGTGRNDRKDGLRLDGMAAAAAGRLRVELLHRGATTGRVLPAVPPPEQALIAALEPRWIRYGPFTLSGAITVGVVAGFGWRIVGEAHIDPTRLGPLHSVLRELGDVPLPLAVAQVLVAVLAVVALCSAGGYVLAFWGFRLTRQIAADGTGRNLHVTRGLITTRATTIEERRLRGVELSEPLLLRAVGGARCIAIATGLRVGRGAERGGSLLLPPAPRAQALRVGADVLGDDRPLSVPLRRHGPVATRRRFVRAMLVAGVLPAGLALLWWLAGLPGWAPLAALVVLPLAAGLAADRAANLGHSVTARHLVLRQGSAVRRRSALERDGIIGWHLRQSFFQRRAGLVTMIATTAAGGQGYRLPDLPAERAPALVEETTPGLLTPFVAGR